jgi:hypothetical protein
VYKTNHGIFPVLQMQKEEKRKRSTLPPIARKSAYGANGRSGGHTAAPKNKKPVKFINLTGTPRHQLER